MKYLKSLILVFIQLIAISANAQYHIEVTVADLTDETAYLGYHFGQEKYVSDTAENINGTFIFEGDIQLPTGIYFLYTQNFYLEFIVSDQNFKIRTHKNQPIEKMEVTGSEENLIFNLLQRFTLPRQVQANRLRTQISETTDAEIKKSLEKELDVLITEVRNYRENLVKEHGDKFVGKFVMALQKPDVPAHLTGDDREIKIKQYQYIKDHYFDQFDISNSDLLRSPIYHSTIMEYLDRIVSPNPDSIINAIDMILAKSEQNPETFRYNLVTLSTKYEGSSQMGVDEVFLHLIENYYLKGKAPWSNEKLLQALRDRAASIKPNLIGNDAPSISLVDTTLNPFDVLHLDARFVVLYFYDPDCGHCKEQTPILKSIYEDLQSKGAEVVAVNITTDIARWKEYIRENNLNWINGADPLVRSNFRHEYDIKSTPTVYILDQDKKILAKRISVENVPKFIDLVLEREQANR